MQDTAQVIANDHRRVEELFAALESRQVTLGASPIRR